MEESEFLFRRLRQSDTDALNKLCSKDSRWHQYFPRHKVWLKRAIGDLNHPGRTAIGAFAPFRNTSGLYENQLQACVFLKTSEYDNSAELKNVVVAADREMPEQRALIRALVNKASRYCEAREIYRLEIELPQAEHQLISLFLELNFHVSASRDRYKPGQLICLMERLIGEVYNGDPFDLVRVGKWLIRSLAPCSLSESTTLEIQGVDGPPCLVFETFPKHAAFSKGAPGYGNRLRIALAILDEPWSSDKNTIGLLESEQWKMFPLRYVIGVNLSETAQKQLASGGVNVFCWEAIKQIAGGEKSSLSIGFEQDQVGGVLTVLELELIAQYQKYENGFAYYLLSGLGSVLYTSSESQPDSGPDLLVIYCPCWTDGKTGIVGVAEISEVTHRPLENAHEAFPGIPRPIERTDLEYYRSRSDIDTISVLKCKRLSIFDQVLTLDAPDWERHTPMRDYLKTELASPINSAYIDYDTTELLTQYERHHRIQREDRGQGVIHGDPEGQIQLDLSDLILNSGRFVVSCWFTLEKELERKTRPARFVWQRNGNIYLFECNGQSILQIEVSRVNLGSADETRLRNVLKGAEKRWSIYNELSSEEGAAPPESRARIHVNMREELEMLLPRIEEIVRILEIATDSPILRYLKSPITR
jgi:GrpB-like predicted nucleotidyltransferase (UPF0157 family)